MIKDLRWVSISEIVSRTASIVTVPILTRALVPSEFGIYRTALLALSLFTLLGYFNVNSLPRKGLPELPHEDKGGLITALLIFTISLLSLSSLLVLGVSFAGLTSVVSPKIEEFIVRSPGLFTLLFFSNGLYLVSLNVFTGLEDFRIYSLVKVAVETTILGMILYLWLTNSISVLAVLWVLTVGRVIGFVLSIVSFRNLLASSPNFGELKSLLRSISLPLLPRMLIKNVEESIIDVIIISGLGPAMYAAWQVTLTFDKVFLLLGRPFSRTLLPKLTEKRSNRDLLAKTVCDYYVFMSVTIVPAILGGWLIGDEIIRYVFGKGYVVTGSFVGLMVSGIGIKTLGTLASHFYIAMDESEFETYAGIAGFAAYFPLTMVGGFLLDSITVIALGYALAWSIRLLISVWYQNRKIDFAQPSISRLLRVGIALALMSGAIAILKLVLVGPVSVIVTIVVAIVLYFAVLFFTGFFTESEIRVAKKFLPW